MIIHWLFFVFKQKTAYDIEYGLVGSEMCIRDSAEGVTVVAVGAGGGKHRRQRADVGFGMGGGFQPDGEGQPDDAAGAAALGRGQPRRLREHRPGPRVAGSQPPTAWRGASVTALEIFHVFIDPVAG